MCNAAAENSAVLLVNFCAFAAVLTTTTTTTTTTLPCAVHKLQYDVEFILLPVVL